MSQRDQRELRQSTDRSGTVTVGGTSQLVAAANPNRAYLFIQNPSAAAESLFVNENAAASTGAGNCWELLPGSSLQFQAHGLILTGAFFVTAATAGHAFTCKEA